MAYALTCIFLLALVIAMVARFWSARRRAAKRAAEAREREAKEREILRRLESIKQKDSRAAAAAAIAKDPARAARTVAKMMRQTKDSD